MLDEEPRLREHVLHYLANEVHVARETWVGSGGRSAICRVAWWLVTESRKGHPSLLRLPAGQQGLAEELGLSRVSVNRALRELARAGLISTRPRAVVLLDNDRLAAWVE
jgi:CRP/FNR family transcriptional regulator